MIFAEMLYRFKLTHINLPEGHQGLAEVSLLKNGGWFEGYAGLIGGSDRSRALPRPLRLVSSPPHLFLLLLTAIPSKGLHATSGPARESGEEKKKEARRGEKRKKGAAN